jgi:hypothetical protein
MAGTSIADTTNSWTAIDTLRIIGNSKAAVTIAGGNAILFKFTNLSASRTGLQNSIWAVFKKNMTYSKEM